MRRVMATLVAGLLLACVHYNGSDYMQLAQQYRYQTMLDITLQHCLDHAAAAAHLRDRHGSTTAMRVPLGTANAIDQLADAHYRQSLICMEVSKRDAAGQLDPDSEARILAAWWRIWQTGASLVEGK